MNVDISWDKLVIERVWFDASCGRLFIQAGDFVNSIDFAKIPDEDFESKTPVSSFTVAQSGSVILCRHKDGAETWLPADLWLPEGFTPRKP